MINPESLVKSEVFVGRDADVMNPESLVKSEVLDGIEGISDAVM